MLYLIGPIRSEPHAGVRQHKLSVMVVITLTLCVFDGAEAAGFRTPDADRGREEDPGGRGLPRTKQAPSHQERREGTEESPTEDQK